MKQAALIKNALYSLLVIWLVMERGERQDDPEHEWAEREAEEILKEMSRPK